MSVPQQIGPYQVVRELGRGGMGVVYEAWDPAASRRVALKLMLGARTSSDGFERFKREALFLARVRHDNVVQVHQVGASPQGPYIVTGMVEGSPLLSLCDGQPADPRQAAEIVRALADALVAIHAEGIVHRDLKPSNVVIRADGRPVLLDFGLARDVDGETLTRTGAVLGTPHYMSPEQAYGKSPKEMDGRTDVYGLGVLLFVLLAGHPPFPESGALTLLKRVIKDEPAWPSSEHPDTPVDLEAICKVAMSKSPDDRYPSAGAMRDELDRFLAGEALDAPPASASNLPLLLVGLGALVLLAGAVALFAIQGQTPAERPGKTQPVAESPRETAAPAPPKQRWGKRSVSISIASGKEVVRGAIRREQVDGLRDVFDIGQWDVKGTGHIWRGWKLVFRYRLPKRRRNVTVRLVDLPLSGGKAETRFKMTFNGKTAPNTSLSPGPSGELSATDYPLTPDQQQAGWNTLELQITNNLQLGVQSVIVSYERPE